MRRPIFVRALTAGERARLEEMWYTSKPLEQMRIRIVLESCNGLTAAEIGQQLGWTPRAVRRVIQRFNMQGIASIFDRRRTNPGRRRIITDEWQEMLLAMIEQPPSAYGYSAPRWTAKLLADALGQSGHSWVGEERVRHYLRRNGYQFVNRQWSRAVNVTPMPPAAPTLEHTPASAASPTLHAPDYTPSAHVDAHQFASAELSSPAGDTPPADEQRDT